MSDERPSRLEQPRADHEIFEAFKDEQAAFGIDPNDGMPKPAVQTTLDISKAPLLEVDTLVLMSVESSFVVRNKWGEILQAFTPEEVERLPNGQWMLSRKDPVNGAVVVVEPLRPACKHYARQMTDFEDSADHTMTLRLCTARRDSEGEFLSVRDRKMLACELRDPRDPVSCQKLDAFDRELLAAARLVRKQEKETFDVEDALETENEDR